MREGSRVVMFAGPTLAASARRRTLVRGIRVRRPVRRRDVETLVSSAHEPGVLVLVDGVFHDSLAVGHAEIREALARGWSVWGLSSMGAIRAREMAPLGVQGFGRVFERFCRGDDFQDDEVALLHEASPPYRAVSEPLFHLREALAHLAQLGIVGRPDAQAVIETLKSRWYGERTLYAATQLLAHRAPRATDAIRRELSDFARFRTKTLDLERFLEERPWRTAIRSPHTSSA